MANLPSTNFSMGDQVVGLPWTYPAAGVTWVPDASGFDSMCRARGPVGHFVKQRTEEMLSIARGLAPVDTGELMESLYIEYGKWEGGIYGGVFTEVEYALFQEYGTVSHGPTPYLRPALEAVMQDVVGSGMDFPEDWQGEAGMIGDFSWDSGERDWF